jgi:hypothetical protein
MDNLQATQLTQYGFYGTLIAEIHPRSVFLSLTLFEVQGPQQRRHQVRHVIPGECTNRPRYTIVAWYTQGEGFLLMSMNPD